MMNKDNVRNTIVSFHVSFVSHLSKEGGMDVNGKDDRKKEKKDGDMKEEEDE